MLCTTVKEGIECSFMSKKGCQFNGGACHPIVDKCEGCQKVSDLEAGKYCSAFPDPSAKWRFGNCSMATHIKKDTKQGNGKINPLKASKRKAA
ncbi:MAG: PxxKW family cysteine-rich protein [Desulfatiglans sp.]|nr:PxxKW family cysteine-rich protein [Thermodesulfobacteriota bacterium]MEE4352415.1 PxxKW family cysteine-rich protein [Desulfatiglans sp.]